MTWCICKCLSIIADRWKVLGSNTLWMIPVYIVYTYLQFRITETSNFRYLNFVIIYTFISYMLYTYTINKLKLRYKLKLKLLSDWCPIYIWLCRWISNFILYLEILRFETNQKTDRWLRIVDKSSISNGTLSGNGAKISKKWIRKM